MPAEIRTETPSDHRSISRGHDLAFGQALEGLLVERLRKSRRIALSLVAVVGGEVVGHVLFSPVALEPRLEPRLASLVWVAMGPLGVVPTRQSMGIGSRLVMEGIDRCRADGCDGVVLLGGPTFYSRFGFLPARAFNLTSDYGDGPEFQAIRLGDEVYLPMRHRVVYSPEFLTAGPGIA